MKKLIVVLFLAMSFVVPAAQAVIFPHVVKGALILIPIMAKYSSSAESSCYETKAVKDGSGNDTNVFTNSEVACK